MLIDIYSRNVILWLFGVAITNVGKLVPTSLSSSNLIVLLMEMTRTTVYIVHPVRSIYIYLYIFANFRIYLEYI